MIILDVRLNLVVQIIIKTAPSSYHTSILVLAGVVKNQLSVQYAAKIR